jgi:hypothetical protein
VINWELLSAFDMAKLCSDITDKRNFITNTFVATENFPKRNFTSYEIFQQPTSDSLQFNDSFLSEISSIRATPILFVEGILVLNDVCVANLCDIKYFLKLDYETCLNRRKCRTYDPPDPLGYFDLVAWPFYVKNLEELQNSHVENLAFMTGKDSIAENFSRIFNDLIEGNSIYINSA